MAITLPDTTAYGARASLRASGSAAPTAAANVQLAESLSIAVNEFDSIMKERRAKDNALNYSLARNEMMRANVESQAELEDDPDWQTYDTRYQDAINTRFEEISSKYDLSQSDRQILGSEGRLIAARGRVTVSGLAKQKEVEWGLGQLDSGLNEARETFLLARSVDESNAVMTGSLQLIEAARERGYLTDQEAEARRQTVTQDFAAGSLEMMSDAEEERELAHSLMYRRGYGSRIGEYANLIRDASMRYDIPADLIAQQISVESSGDPEARSGAYGDPTGLMQIGEAAAADLGITDRTDPAQNIDGGVRYLKQMEDAFYGDRAKALAAYNWGRANVLEAFDKHGEDWLLHAPEETRNYVAKLLPVWEGTKSLDKNLLRTNVGDGPITPEEIAAGNGSGSVADFLPADIVAGRLKALREQNKEDRTREQAFSALDTARRMFPSDSQEAHEARMEWIRKNTKGAVRDKAELEARQLQNDFVAAKTARSQELYDQHWRAMMDAPDDAQVGYNQIPAEDLEDMLPHHREALKKRWQEDVAGRRTAPVTQYEDPGDGGMSMAEWNLMNPFGQGGKTDQDLDSPLFRNAFTAEDLTLLAREQAALSKLENAQIKVPNMRPSIVDMYNAQGIELDDGSIARLEQRLVMQVAEKQQGFVPPRALSQVEINKEIADLMSYEASTFRQFGPGLLGWIKESEKPVHEMSAEEFNNAYISVERAKVEQYPVGPGEAPRSMHQHLLELHDQYVGENVEPDEMDIARAYFAIEYGLPDHEVIRRLKGE